jgi:glycosyltransferase involved in cell wall biosynthesis
MRISVIMAVCLSPYELVENGYTVFQSAPDPERKFIRAVNSFINQSFKDAELIIVADGCKMAEAIYHLYLPRVTNIRFKLIDKQVPWGGKVRQTGIEMASGKIICYLDHDDMLGNDHLSIINANFNLRKYAWAYYDDIILADSTGNIPQIRNVRKQQCSIGTSSIAHRKSAKVIWGDGYVHDWYMIEKCLLHLPDTKIQTPQYYVAHNSSANGIGPDGKIL